MKRYQDEADRAALAVRILAPMKGRRWLAATLIAGGLAVSGCAEAPSRLSTVEAFRDTSLIETQLKKGVSTIYDVKRVLGEPTGSGATYLAVAQQRPEEMWFYQDIEVTDIKSSQGQLDLKMRQQILIVFVRDGLFDGFMWFSNVESATAWVKDSLRGKIGVMK